MYINVFGAMPPGGRGRGAGGSRGGGMLLQENNAEAS